MFFADAASDALLGLNFTAVEEWLDSYFLAAFGFVLTAIAGIWITAIVWRKFKEASSKV